MGGQQLRTAIATSTCLTLGMAVAVAMGAVPRAVGSTASAEHHVSARVHAAYLVHHALPVRRASGVQVARALPVALPVTAAAPPATVTPHPTAHRKHHRKHHHHKQVAPKPVAPKPVAAKPVAAKPVAPKPVAPKLAPRTTPSASAVAGAIAGLKGYVHTIFTPTAAQVAQFGDEVCSAFDKNETVAQVKAVILQKVQQLPFTTVSAGADDYVVKTAVKLYCPGYTSRVS